MKKPLLPLLGAALLSLFAGAQARLEVTTGPSIRVERVHSAPARATVVRTPVRTVRYEWRAAGVSTGAFRQQNARVVRTLSNPGRSVTRRTVVVTDAACAVRTGLPTTFQRVYYANTSAYRTCLSNSTLRLTVAPRSSVRVWRAETVQPRTYRIRLYRVLADGRAIPTAQVRSTTVYTRVPVTSVTELRLSS